MDIPPSQYRKALPAPAVAFESVEGKAMFKSALISNGCKSFFKLISQFTTQSEPAYCGLSTLVIVLNALCIDPRQRRWSDGIWRWYHEDMLSCCKPLDLVKREGLTFREFACLSRCQGVATTPVPASDDLDGSRFRGAISQCLVERDGVDGGGESGGDDAFLVVSYSRRTLNQSGEGHFSPIAAYDEKSDCVLILDTARFKYPSHWVPVSELLRSMKEVDKSTSRPRGFLVLSRKVTDKSSSFFPLSPAVGSGMGSSEAAVLPPPPSSTTTSRHSDGLHMCLLLDWRALTLDTSWRVRVETYTARLVTYMLNVVEIAEHVTEAGGVFGFLQPKEKPVEPADIQRVNIVLDELKRSSIYKFLSSDPEVLSVLSDSSASSVSPSLPSSECLSCSSAACSTPQTAVDLDPFAALTLLVLASDVILSTIVEGWGASMWQILKTGEEEEETGEMGDLLRSEVQTIADIFLAFYEDK